MFIYIKKQIGLSAFEICDFKLNITGFFLASFM